MQHLRRRLMLGAAAATAVVGGIGALAVAPHVAFAHAASSQHVYVLNNGTLGNSITAYDRDAAGHLTALTTTAIGGTGTGATLGSQSSLIHADDYLFAVDAGSNQVSIVAVTHAGLKLDSIFSSNGATPISVTYNHNHLYVLNSGNTTTAANVTGFWIDDGKATPIENSTQPLSAAHPNPGEVQASPDGNALVVTEKGTSTIDLYHINHDGSLSAPTSVPSTGNTPYGFAFNPARDEQLVVSDAGSNAVTSYALKQGSLQALDGPVADQQTAPCWLLVTYNGDYAYTANAGSGTLSGYRIGDDGKLSLLDANGVTGVTGTGSHPLEMALSRGGRFIFVLDSGTSTISAFAINHDGSLSNVAQSGVTLPAGATGLAAD